MTQIIDRDTLRKVEKFNRGIKYRELKAFSSKWVNEKALVVFSKSNKEIDGTEFYMTKAVESALEGAEFFKTESGAAIAAKINDAVFILTQDEALLQDFLESELIGDEEQLMRDNLNRFLMGGVLRNIRELKASLEGIKSEIRRSTLMALDRFGHITDLEESLSRMDEISEAVLNQPRWVSYMSIPGIGSDTCVSLTRGSIDKETFIKKATAQLQNDLTYFRSELAKSRIRIKRHYSNLAETASQLALEEKKLEFNNSDSSQPYLQEFLSYIQKSALFSDVSMNEDGSLRLHVAEYVVHYDGTDYKLGEFDIDMYDNGGLYVINGIERLSYAHRVHPHINGGVGDRSGRICMGSELLNIYRSYSNQKAYLSMIECIALILRSYNPGDAYSDLTRFPKA